MNEPREIRPLYWSVRRELWENRSVYVAPLVVVSLLLTGFLISAFTLPRHMRAALKLDPVKQHSVVAMPYNTLAGMVIIAAFIVGAFYCLEALHGERRDRSILFWKSLPVSDRTTVLSKASIPLVVMPLFNFVFVLSAQAVMLLFSSLILLGDPPALAVLMKNVKYWQSAVGLLYGLIAIALWHASVYAWLLMVSAWAKRAAVLWAVLPLLAVGALEKIIFNSTHFVQMLGYRLSGWYESGFRFHHGPLPAEPLDHLTPLNFLATPDLWSGLVFAALFLWVAVRLRRNREPI